MRNNDIHIITREKITLLYFIETNKIIRLLDSVPLKKVKDIVNKGLNGCLESNDGLEGELKNYFIENFDTKEKDRTFDFYCNDASTSNRITLMLTQDCNLACKYCYGGESGGFNSKGSKMTLETAKSAINYLLATSSNSNIYRILFFGGEPLLNFEVMQSTVSYCEEITTKTGKRFTYGLTTNATLLNDAIMSFLEAKKIGITISLDGDKNVHDSNRCFPNKKGSYDIVINNINKLNHKSIPFNIRATLTKDFFDQYDVIYEHLSSLGAKGVHISKVSIYEGINDQVMGNYSGENSLYYDEYYEKPESIKAKFTEHLIYAIKSASKRRVFCGFMRGCTAVTSTGDFYPCHRFVGMEGYKFGNLLEGINKSVMMNIFDGIDNATKRCEECFARYICQRHCLRDISCDNLKFKEFGDKLCMNTRMEIEDAIVEYYVRAGKSS